MSSRKNALARTTGTIGPIYPRPRPTPKSARSVQVEGTKTPLGPSVSRELGVFFILAQRIDLR